MSSSNLPIWLFTAILCSAKLQPDLANPSGYEPDEMTSAMADAARRALIEWSEAVADFRDGAFHILEKGMSARHEVI